MPELPDELPELEELSSPPFDPEDDEFSFPDELEDDSLLPNRLLTREAMSEATRRIGEGRDAGELLPVELLLEELEAGRAAERDLVERFAALRGAAAVGRAAAGRLAVARFFDATGRLFALPRDLLLDAFRDFDAVARDFEAAPRDLEAVLRDFDAEARDFEAAPRDFDAEARDFEAPPRDDFAALRDLADDLEREEAALFLEPRAADFLAPPLAALRAAGRDFELLFFVELLFFEEEDDEARLLRFFEGIYDHSFPS